MVLVGNLFMWEEVAERSRTQGCPELHSEFKSSLSYIGLCFKKIN